MESQSLHNGNFQLIIRQIHEAQKDTFNAIDQLRTDNRLQHKEIKSELKDLLDRTQSSNRREFIYLQDENKELKKELDYLERKIEKLTETFTKFKSKVIAWSSVIGGSVGSGSHFLMGFFQ